MDSRSEMPRAGEVLVRPAQAGENSRLNACFFTEGSSSLYEAGYREAAEALFLAIRDDRGTQDTLVYPLVFLWRQYVELVLKDLLLTGRFLRDMDGPPVNHHRIGALWPEVKEHILALFGGDVPHAEDAESVVRQLAQIDPDSFNYRYPTTKAGAPTVRVQPNMSLENFHSVMARLANFLDTAGMAFAHWCNEKGKAEG